MHSQVKHFPTNENTHSRTRTHALPHTHTHTHTHARTHARTHTHTHTHTHTRHCQKHKSYSLPSWGCCCWVCLLLLLLLLFRGAGGANEPTDHMIWKQRYERLLIKTELSVWFSVDCGLDWDGKEATTTPPKRCILIIAGAVLGAKCNNSAQCVSEATCDHTNFCSEYGDDGVCGTLSSRSK